PAPADRARYIRRTRTRPSPSGCPKDHAGAPHRAEPFALSSSEPPIARLSAADVVAPSLIAKEAGTRSLPTRLSRRQHTVARMDLSNFLIGRRLANREDKTRKVTALEGVPAMGLDGLGSSA